MITALSKQSFCEAFYFGYSIEGKKEQAKGDENYKIMRGKLVH